VSVAELFARFGSVVPSGAVTDAVFTMATVAVDATVATIVYVAVPPAARFTTWLMLPDPLPVPEEPVPANTAVHVTPVNNGENVSTTRAPVTKLGPAFVTVTVYVVAKPGTYVGVPSTFVIRKSATGAGRSTRVAVLLSGFGSITPAGGVTVAVFDRVPVTVERTAVVIV
jgi:hypothetical protein